MFLTGQALIGLAVLLNLNMFTVLLGFSALILVAVYPFTKRFTYWPQLFLGLAFNWGALMGWSAVTGNLETGCHRALPSRHVLDHRIRHDLRPSRQGR